MASGLDKRELWVDWTQEALAKYEAPDQIEDADELVDDMVATATKYADSMLDEYEERFESRGGAGRRRKRKDRDDPNED